MAAARPPRTSSPTGTSSVPPPSPAIRAARSTRSTRTPAVPARCGSCSSRVGGTRTTSPRRSPAGAGSRAARCAVCSTSAAIAATGTWRSPRAWACPWCGGGRCACRARPTAPGSCWGSGGWSSESPRLGSRPSWPASTTSRSAPGPTPFLERPLLPLPGAVPEAPPGGGQRMLSRLLDALVARRDIPDGLRDWAERSAAGGFSSLGDCLDELERAGTAAAAVTAADPPGPERHLRRRRARCHGAGRGPGARALASNLHGRRRRGGCGHGRAGAHRPGGARRADSCAGHRPGDDALDAGSPRGRPYPSAGPGRWTAPAPSSSSGPGIGITGTRRQPRRPRRPRLRPRRRLWRPRRRLRQPRRRPHPPILPVGRRCSRHPAAPRFPAREPPRATIAACARRPMTSCTSTRPPAAPPGMPTRRIRGSRWGRRSNRPVAAIPSWASTSRTPPTA